MEIALVTRETFFAELLPALIQATRESTAAGHVLQPNAIVSELALYVDTHQELVRITQTAASEEARLTMALEDVVLLLSEIVAHVTVLTAQTLVLYEYFGLPTAYKTPDKTPTFVTQVPAAAHDAQPLTKGDVN